MPPIFLHSYGLCPREMSGFGQYIVLFGLGCCALVFVVRGNRTSTGFGQACSGGGMRSGIWEVAQAKCSVFYLFMGKGFWYFQSSILIRMFSVVSR